MTAVDNVVYKTKMKFISFLFCCLSARKLKVFLVPFFSKKEHSGGVPRFGRRKNKIPLLRL